MSWNAAKPGKGSGSARMKRVKLLSSLVLLASGGAWAQSTIGVKVGLSLPGPNFYVDGQVYANAQVFLWPVGSTHVIQFPFSVVMGQTVAYQSSTDDTARWSFGGWTDNLGILAAAGSAPVVNLTVLQGMTSVIGNVTELFRLAIIFPTGTGSGGSNTNCSGAPGNPVAP